MKTLGLLAGTVLMGVLVYLGTQAVLDSNTPGRAVLENGVLRVGYAVEPPYAYLDADGRVTGQSPELVRLVAQELGIEQVQWVLVPFSQLIPALNDGEFDMIGISIFVTEARRLQVRFADPNTHVPPALLVRSGSPLLEHPDRFTEPSQGAIAVIEGAEEAKWLAQQISPDRLRVVIDVYDGLALVRSGAAAALALSAPTVTWLAGQHSGLGALRLQGTLTQPAQQMPSALAFRTSDEQFVGRWNEAQRRVTASPNYQVLLERFGFSLFSAEP